MKAVNLIPADQRRGAGGLAGRSGGIVYVVAGGLLVVVVLGVVYALAVKDVANKTGQLNQVTAEANVVQAQANTFQEYIQVHQLSEAKLRSVVSIAQSRFNWPGAMGQLALALPGDVTFTSLTAISSNGSSSAGAAAPSTTAPSTSSTPTFALAGCASSQSEISTILSRLESVPSVTSVSLADSAKQTDQAPNTHSGTVSRGSAGASAGKCPLVSWTINLAYSGTYTVPNQRLPHSSTSPSTLSHSTASTSGVVAGAQVAR